MEKRSGGEANLAVSSPIVFSEIFCFVGFECFCELIGAGGRLEATTNAFQASNCVIERHTRNERGDPLCVTRTATREANFFNSIAFHGELNLSGADAMGCICEPLKHGKIRY